VPSPIGRLTIRPARIGLTLTLLVAASASPGLAQDRSNTRTVTGNTTYTVTTSGTNAPTGRFISVRNSGTTPVVNPRVVVNGKNWRTAGDIVASVVAPGMTDEEKARALWSFARDNRYHWWPPTTGLDSRDAIKLFNAYGYGFCNDVADALANLFVTAGLPARQWVLGAYEHSVAEAFYDGAWHMYDPDRDGLYLAWDNRTVASVHALIADPALVARGGPTHADLVDIYRRSDSNLFSEVLTPASHRLDVTLRPQEELRLSYSAFAGYEDDSGLGGPPPPIYGNGTLTSPFLPSLTGARGLLARARGLRLTAEDGLTPGASPTATGVTSDLVYRVKSPYPIVGASFSGRLRRQAAADVLEIATARNGGSLKRMWGDLASGSFEADGFVTVAEGLSTFWQDANFPAVHASGAGTAGTLTYRMRPLPDSQGRIRVGGVFFRNAAADDVRIQVSQDNQSWQTVWVASQTGYFSSETDIGPLVSAWTSLYVRFAFTASTSFWMAGAEEIRLDGVDPWTYRTAWSATAASPTGSFTQAVDLAPTTAWFGSAPLYEYLVRVRMRSSANHLGVGLDDFTLTTTVQVAPWSLPSLVVGANQFVYADDSTGSRQVVVTHGWTERTDARAPTAPAAPLYPADGAHIVTGDTLSLAWRRATNPGFPIYRYQVWVCDTALCPSPVTTAFELFLHNTDVGPDGLFGTADDGVVDTPLPSVNAALGGLLVPGRRYYWRVRAQDLSLAWSPWSTVWSFVVDETGVSPSSAPRVTIAAPSAQPLHATGAPTLTLTGTAASAAGVSTVRWSVDNGASGVATGTTSWNTGPINLPSGTTSFIVVTATDAQGRVAMDTISVTQGGTVTEYILPEGATGGFFDLDVAVANPNDTAVSATARFLVEGGAEVSVPLKVGPYSRQLIKVDDVPGVGDAAVSTVVTTVSGLPLVVERTTSWDANGYGGHGARAIAGAANRWLFAEGSQGFFDTYLLLANTSGSTANVMVAFFLEGGGRIERSYVVPNAARATIYAGNISELVGRSFAFEVTSTAPITAERATYFGSARMWDGGHSSTGATAPAARWYHAEGATGPFFETFVLIGNPNESTAHVQVTYLTSAGVTVVRQHDVAPQGRLTLNIERQDPALANEAVATIVDSDTPVVSERVSYWGGGWSEGSISLGATAAAVRWGVADGRLGGARGYQTYILVANPDPTRTADVTVRFLTSSGQPILRYYQVPAGRRWNIQVGADVPELADLQFGARLESTNGVPIIVARSTYWNAFGEVWAAGVSVPGTPLP
jgi:hypothetical protein